MTGFSSFKEAFRRINSLSDRMIELGKRGNYNVVLVNDCGANEFVFSDMLYSLLVSKGIIKDQRIVRGDLDDAVCTSSNTSLFYFIVETWDFGNHDGFRWGMPQEESFRLLSRRKTSILLRWIALNTKKRRNLIILRRFSRIPSKSETSRKKKKLSC